MGEGGTKDIMSVVFPANLLAKRTNKRNSTTKEQNTWTKTANRRIQENWLPDTAKMSKICNKTEWGWHVCQRGSVFRTSVFSSQTFRDLRL